MTPRFGNAVWLLFIGACAFGLYMVKYRVQAIQGEIAGLTRQWEEERENLHVVAAEWAYLTQPERLQHLSDKYLKLQPQNPVQVADMDTLPRFVPQPGETGQIVPASLAVPEGE